MVRFRAYLLAHPAVVKGLILGYVVFAGCFTFPFGNKEFPLDLTKAYLVLVGYGVIGLGFAGIYGVGKERFVGGITLLLTVAGLLCRFLLEYGEVSNVMNFTPWNVILYLVLVPLYTLLTYHFIVKYLTKSRG